MALVQTIGFTPTLFTSNGYYEQANRWDGYSEYYAAIGTDSTFQGYSLNWGTFDAQTVVGGFANQPYAGYTTNWGGISLDGALGSVVNQPYAGYTTNWGSYEEPIKNSIENVDTNSVVDHPKDQTIYYKMKGYNTITQQFESWIITHNITGRPALDGGLFDPDPGRNPPNFERDVWTTPPSGNALVNIVIAARWIE